MKSTAISWLASAAALICLATAQTSQVRSSSAKPGPDPVQSATKPLTPKSAMPSHQKSAAGPKASTNAGKTNAELNHLERQPIKAGSSNSGSARAPKVPSATKSADPSGSGINFKYQKPTTPPPPQIPKKN